MLNLAKYSGLLIKAILATGFGIVIIGNSASAETIRYRDQPTVLAAERNIGGQDTQDVILRQVRQRNARRGSRRIAVYWGQRLDQEVKQSDVQYEASGKRADLAYGAARGVDRRQGVGVELGSAVATGQSLTVRGTQRLKGGEKSTLAARKSWEMESKFNETLQAAGFQLVGHDLATRRAAVGAADHDLNVLEMQGLDKSADIVLEILGEPDAAQASGWRFRVIGTELKTSRVVMDLVTYASPVGTAPKRFVATKNGFEREGNSDSTTGNVGRQLAIEVAQKL